MSLILKINDRHKDNVSIIQVSRKSAQLLKFYKNKITKVRVEILPDPSKQMKVVTQSISEPNFNKTITSAPTETVSITDIIIDVEQYEEVKYEAPIEIGFSEVIIEKIFLKVFGFDSYDKAKLIFTDLNIMQKFTTEKEQGSYTLIIGPLENIEANNLVLSFISKGYKKTKFFLE